MPTIPLPIDEEDQSRLADWLEINALLENDGSASFDELESNLKTSKPSNIAEELSIAAYNEIRMRFTYLKESYPFELSGRLVKRKIINNWTYIFCLLISYIGPDTGARALKIWKVNQVTHIFEKICTRAAESYFSDNKCRAEAIQFGAPRSSWPRRIRPFVNALKYMKEHLLEGDVRGTSREMAKDGGLDVLAWRHFPDKMPGKIILLGQCSTSKYNYTDKLSEIESFLNNDYRIEHQRLKCFFLPHSLFSDNSTWGQINRSAGIPFDRCRISYYAADWDGAEIKDIFDKIKLKLVKYRKSL